MKNKKKNDFLVQGTILALASVVVRLIGIIYRIPLQKILGDEGMGYYGTAFEIYSFLLILSSYSFPGSISKLVSTRVAKKEYKNAYKVLICGLGFATVFGSIAASVSFFFSLQLAEIFEMPQASLALKALTPTLFLVAFMGVFRGFFQGFGTMLPTAISQIIEKVVQVIASLILCYTIITTATKSSLTDNSIIPAAHGAYGATMGNNFGSIFALGFLIFVFWAFYPVLKKKIKRYNNNEESYVYLLKIMFFTTVPILLSTTINNVSILCDNYIVGNVLDAQGYKESEIATLWGIFSNKYKTFITLPVSVASSMAVSTMPSMSAAIAVNDRNTALSKIGSSIRFIYIFSAPCAVGVAVMANPLLQFLYYDGTTGNKVGTQLLWLGAVSIIISSLVSITSAILQGLGHLRLPVKHCGIGLIVHIFVALFLMIVCKLSIYAVVLAEIVLNGTTLYLNFRYIIKNYNYKQELRKSILIPSISAVSMGIVTFIVYKLLKIITTSRVILLLIPIVIAVVVYVILMIILKGIERDDLLEMPKGQLLLKIFTKLHLM